MVDTNLRNRLVNKFRELIDDGYIEFDIKIIDNTENGYIINPTKYSESKPNKNNG